MPATIDADLARILVVDDQESNVRLLEFALRRAGFTAVTSTTEPLDVCMLHRRDRYELILLDLQMPRMNGFEVMAGLAKLDVEGKVPILVLSADPAQNLRALEAGATAFLSKPFVLAEVTLAVQLMLDARRDRPVKKRAPVPATLPLLLPALP